MTSPPIIRTLSLEETERLIDWARVEGWNPGLADAEPFRAADPSGFIGCFVGPEMVSGISAVRYGSAFGFIGLYICHPAHRGKGFGRLVWDAGMAHLEGRTIGLDGVPQQQANYRSMGFMPAYQTSRWSGRLDVVGGNNGTVRVTPDLLDQLLTFDARHFPAERSSFLREWLRFPRSAHAVIRDGAIRGYAVMRQCHDGFKIGPLFAETFGEAETLLEACAAEVDGAVLHLDIPDEQGGFAEYLRERGFSRGFTTARMYRGPAPRVHTAGIFAITTLELG
ncbi:MAG: GNAT family N-acetyltransferase [Alphaproteobacteria bacterium]|nr:GNAT family N-acetyltransferase [Rhizobiaceae bacterium]MBU3959634.1 GNAT family N-acetyltransferase [Alphaproteobacteria bacterium]MBU4051453.1 GNAT family N-acetyltransferase [Alphaproteobacteria bacterium]MBU4087955.1 GNAT family N-acetyltransferase [Alphaproteobacteria bacterium]MBU4156209.1 GNAT family N-acetyltransferase [Alphaproteobacteria bacterium]